MLVYIEFITGTNTDCSKTYNRLKSTKSDAENHGVGLASVYRAVAKYHGSVVIEDSEPGKFKIRIVLYSNVQE